MTSKGHLTYLEYIDHQGQKVAEEEDSNNTEQHPGETLLSGLAPDHDQPVIIRGKEKVWSKSIKGEVTLSHISKD